MGPARRATDRLGPCRRRADGDQKASARPRRGSMHGLFTPPWLNLPGSQPTAGRCNVQSHSEGMGVMRILILSNLYPPNVVGGYERLCYEVTAGLAASGHEMTVLTSNYGSGVANYPAQHV